MNGDGYGLETCDTGDAPDDSEPPDAPDRHCGCAASAREPGIAWAVLGAGLGGLSPATTVVRPTLREWRIICFGRGVVASGPPKRPRRAAPSGSRATRARGGWLCLVLSMSSVVGCGSIPGHGCGTFTNPPTEVYAVTLTSSELAEAEGSDGALSPDECFALCVSVASDREYVACEVSGPGTDSGDSASATSVECTFEQFVSCL